MRVPRLRERKGAKWKVKSGKTRKYPQTSQASQYSQTHYAGRVSPANAGRWIGVQNGGLQRTERTGEKSWTPIRPIGPINPMKKYADRVSPANAGSVQGVQNGELQRTERTKRTGEKSRTPIRPIGPISPMKKYADRVSKMRWIGVQNGGSQLRGSGKRCPACGSRKCGIDKREK